MPDIFLNCDLSEHDALPHSSVMQHVHMASLACRDEKMIRSAAQLAEQSAGLPVSTGALFCHPDPLSGHSISVEELQRLLHIQLIRFTASADLNHVKLDEALFRLIENDVDLRSAFLAFIRSRCLISIVCPLGSNLEKLANEMKLPVTPEILLDAHYSNEGELTADAIDSTRVITRLEQLHQFGSLTADHGENISIPEQYDHITVSLSSPVDLDQLKKVRSYLDAI